MEILHLLWLPGVPHVEENWEEEEEQGVEMKEEELVEDGKYDGGGEKADGGRRRALGKRKRK